MADIVGLRELFAYCGIRSGHEQRMGLIAHIDAVDGRGDRFRLYWEYDHYW
ncbi:MAG: hypothetical protein WBB01_03795 [Phormidesmis sp.]